ncbi:unnamed protein product [Brassica napus]|uniref:(rape) hypothetical protein n=1 Tax=Brassica napus TaxID=3708 RepID=A0A817B6B1_BRANA|nr:unnamed protein product [Brassica napus]
MLTTLKVCASILILIIPFWDSITFVSLLRGSQRGQVPLRCSSDGHGYDQQGKKILSKLTDAIGLDSVETSWENVQASLSHLTVEMKDVYVDSLISMEPELNCHPPGVNTVCFKCYHAYLMTEFFEMALGLNPASASA